MPREIYGQRDYYEILQRKHNIATELISKTEAAQVLGISYQQFWRLLKAKKIKESAGKVSLWSLAGYVASMS
jgi:hypothetical protein